MRPARGGWLPVAAFLRGLVLAALGAALPVQASECNPAPPAVATLQPRPSGLHSVLGPLADFDPCHRSVDLNLPWGAPKPALFIIAHGGSGVGLAENNLAYALRRQGFATLLFDAFKTNGFSQGFEFWATKVTNEARQRMIYKVAMGAYRWALGQDGRIDASRIYLHGLSNGATTVVNMAAAVDPAHVKAVFAEGLPGAGLGLPDDLKVPVRLVHGKLDNYGGRQLDEWRWLIREKCLANGLPALFIQPPGNAAQCNAEFNPQQMTATPMEWFEVQRAKGADIDNWWYEDAAHGMFGGPIVKQQRTYGHSDTRFAWTGADHAARAQFLADLKAYLGR